MLIASCISTCLVMLSLRIACLHWALLKVLYRSAARTAPIKHYSDLIDFNRSLLGRCWGAVQSAVQGALRTAPLCFPERTEQRRCTGAVQKRSTYSVQGKFEANLSKQPHFVLASYIYATLTLGQLQEFIFRFHI